MDRKDAAIVALSEIVQELNNKIINLRVEMLLAIETKDKTIEELTGKRVDDRPKANGGNELRP
jgi:hypothetical protein